MTLTFNILKGSCTHLVDCIYQFWYHRLQYFLKNPLFYLFPIQSIRDQIWPCRKIGQCQPRVIIWTNFVVLMHPMLHTKFQEVIGEEDFFKDFYHIWAWRPSWSCDLDRLKKLLFPLAMKAPYEIWLWLAKQFLRRSNLKSVDERRQTADDGGLLTYKLTSEPGSLTLRTVGSWNHQVWLK